MGRHQHIISDSLAHVMKRIMKQPDSKIISCPSHNGIRHAGVGRFITFRSYKLAERIIIWRARHHRKGLLLAARALENLPVPFWQTRFFNKAIGAIFAIGSALFMLGSLIALFTHAQEAIFVANIVFFLGSIPFTVAAYMQHFQAANAAQFSRLPSDDFLKQELQFIGWKPDDLGWLSTLTQFIGTLAFNISTFDAIQASRAWLVQDVTIWMPDMIGSLLFLISAYLAFIETCDHLWKWKPHDISWQIVFTNLLGCIAFIFAACTSYVLPGWQPEWISQLSNSQLLVGAACFLAGSLLTIKESEMAEHQ